MNKTSKCMVLTTYLTNENPNSMTVVLVINSWYRVLQVGRGILFRIRFERQGMKTKGSTAILHSKDHRFSTSGLGRDKHQTPQALEHLSLVKTGKHFLPEPKYGTPQAMSGGQGVAICGHFAQELDIYLCSTLNFQTACRLDQIITLIS